MSSSAFQVLQIVTSMLCAAAAFGVLLTTILVRGNLKLANPDGATSGANSEIARFDMIYTDKTYLLASIMASLGALTSFRHNTGVFVMFVVIAISFQIAEHWLLPRMRRAAQQGLPLPLIATRMRFEALQAGCLLMVFGNLSMPPLITLVRVYGL